MAKMTGMRRRQARAVDAAASQQRPSRDTQRVGRPCRSPVPGGVPSELDLVPGVRDRLQVRLAAMGVLSDKTVSHVARLTHRAAQSVRRWFDPQVPGLPDLESFARLCVGLGCSADDIIGMPCETARISSRDVHLIAVADCVHSMTGSLTRRGCLGVPIRVPGDEMAPRFREGDLVFVDTAVGQFAGNGIYALECGGKLIIRRVEQRIGDGMVLKCDNKAYRDHELKSVASAKRRGVKIVGKVHGVISARIL